MKNIKYLLGALGCALAISSCSLDETNYTEMSKPEYMNSAAEAQNVLLGVYRNNVSEGMYRFHLSLYFTLPNDLAKVEGSSTDGFRNIPTNSYTSSQSEVATTWADLYNAIYDANDFIETLSQRVNGYNEENRQLAAIYMAEARTLRAMYYFELVRWFGHVPLITTTAQSHLHPSQFVQADPVDVYKFIESDLKYAIDILPYATADNYRSDNSYRMSKGSALGLLAKVYATWAGYPVQDESKWEEAAKTAQTLVQSGRHSLLPDYKTLWENTCDGKWDPQESLIEISFYAPVVTGTNSNDPIGRIGKWNGVTANGIRGVRNAGNWKVIPTFLRDWTKRESDKRFKLSAADYKYGTDKAGNVGVEIPVTDKGTLEQALSNEAENTVKQAYINGICPAKWDTEKYVGAANYLVDANMSNVNWYVLRYADVLLLYAEALNEWKHGPTPDAVRAVNMVRRRGFGLPVEQESSLADITATNYDNFRDLVRKERAYELAFEGHRRQDLTRWGIYYESIQQTARDLIGWYEQGSDYYVCEQFTRKNKNELLPIPLREMDLCPQFKQNPGW